MLFSPRSMDTQGGPWPHPLSHFETEDISVEDDLSIEIRHLEVNISDPYSSRDWTVVRHDSPGLLAQTLDVPLRRCSELALVLATEL